MRYFTLCIALAAHLLLLRPAQGQDGLAYLLDQVNALRASRGLNTLSVNAALSAAAQGHSTYLATTVYIHPHRQRNGSLPQDRAAAVGYGGRVGENVVGGRSATPQWAFNWWLNSPVHLSNMLGGWTEIGLGYSDGGEYGKWYVLVFGNAGRAPAPAEAPAAPPANASGSGESAPPVRAAPTRPPPPTATPTVTFTPSITYTPRATFTPTHTATFQPPTATAIVLAVTPQRVAALPTAPSMSTLPPAVEVAPTLSLPAAPPPRALDSGEEGLTLRQLIPWLLGLQALVIGSMAFSAIMRRRR
jgi:hypothetical protein